MMVQQGHRYRGPGMADWLALTSGDGFVDVAPIDESKLWPLGEPRRLHASCLEAKPMRYFHGAIPEAA